MDKYKLYEGIWVIKSGFITLSEFKKIFYLFSNSIDCETLAKMKRVLKRVSKSYSNNQLL